MNDTEMHSRPTYKNVYALHKHDFVNSILCSNSEEEFGRVNIH